MFQRLHGSKARPLRKIGEFMANNLTKKISRNSHKLHVSLGDKLEHQGFFLPRLRVGASTMSFLNSFLTLYLHFILH